MGSAGTFGDSITGGGKSAQKANKRNVKQIKQLFDSLNIYGDEKFGEAMKAIEGAGSASKADALSLGKQYSASATQNLANMGLSGSTAANAAQRGVHSDTLRRLGLINEDIARMRAGLFTGQAGFRQGNVQSLASILGGVQHQPGYNYLGGLMQGGAQLGSAAILASDLRLKNVIRVVRTATWNGMEFPVVRFTYKDSPDGEWEGVIAQDVRHIPGVVTRGADGYFLVNVDALKRKTGVEIKRVASGVAV